VLGNVFLPLLERELGSNSANLHSHDSTAVLSGLHKVANIAKHAEEQLSGTSSPVDICVVLSKGISLDSKRL